MQDFTLCDLLSYITFYPFFFSRQSCNLQRLPRCRVSAITGALSIFLSRLSAPKTDDCLRFIISARNSHCTSGCRPRIHAENYQVRVWSHSFLRHMCVNWLKKERWSFLIGVMCLQRKYLTHGEKKRRRLRNEFDLPVSCFAIWLVRTQTDLWFLPI